MSTVDTDPLARLLAETTADPRRRLLLELVRELLEDESPSGTPRPPLPSDDELLVGLRREMQRRGVLPNAIDARVRFVRALMRWAEPRSVLELETSDIEDYLDSCNIISNTRRGYLSNLSCFYKWAIAQGYTGTNPTAAIARPRQRNGQPRPLSDAELAQVLDPAGFLPDDPIHRRVRCFVLLGAFAGLRCQEIAGLEAHDIDRERNVIVVRKGKGAKQRTVPAHPLILEALDALPMPASGPIFRQCTNGGTRSRRSRFTETPVTPLNVSAATKWHLRARGVNATAHQLRHTFASRAYKATRDLRLTQELLGHESPTMTARYAAGLQFGRGGSGDVYVDPTRHGCGGAVTVARFRTAWQALAERARTDDELWALAVELDAAFAEVLDERGDTRSVNPRGDEPFPTPPVLIDNRPDLSRDPLDLLNAYVRDQERRGLSPLYAHEMTLIVKRFVLWMEPRSALLATREDVEAWLDSLHIGHGGRRNAITHLHGYYLYAVERVGLTEAPTAKIGRPRQHRYLPKPIRDDHLQLALDKAPNPELLSWLLLGCYAGFRCLEMGLLHREDVDTTGGVLRVRKGKGSKERVVPAHPMVLDALDALPMPEAGPLYLMPDGRRVPPYVVSQRIGRHLDSLDISSWAHSLRHWYGSRLYQSTGDIRMTQELLGHSSVATTQGYAAWDLTKAAPAVAALSISSVRDTVGS